MCACLEMVRLRSGVGSYPAIRTVLNAWVASTRLHSGEGSGCILGCGDENERASLARYHVCAASCMRWAARPTKRCRASASWLRGEVGGTGFAVPSAPSGASGGGG